MENENKNENRGKGKPRRHKSYFMTPNAEQKESAPKVEQAPKSPSAPSTTEVSHRTNRHKGKPKAMQAPKQEPTVSTQASVAAPAIESAEKPQGFDKSKRNKNKHRKHAENPNSQKDNLHSSHNDSAPQEKDPVLDSDLSFPKFDKLEKPAQKKLESFSASPEFQKYQDYEEFTYDEIYGKLDEEAPQPTETEIKNEQTTEKEPEAQVEIVGIRFKSSGKTYYFSPNGISLRVGLHAIVETARGLEYGEVVIANSFINESEIVSPLRTVVRAATPADTLHNEEIKKLEDSAFRICNEKIIAHNLDMKLIDAQYTFDNSKLLFYFTSSGRVDFRELVKDLASVFRTRIELRQIGIRDEAKMVGGLGTCGRPLCCSKFLTDFGQVSIKMAKEQNLSLNSAKISGICGRLMCCLRYEHDTYEYEIKRTPPVDTLVRTVDGVGTVTEISPLQGTIKVRLAATPEVMPKSYKREDVTILKKKN